MSARHASWFCEAVNPFIAICVQWKASAGSPKILAGVCLLCESVAAASCRKHTSLHCDSGRNTAAIQRRLKTYGAHSLDRYLICSSRPNFPDDCLYRFRIETIALGEKRQSITHSGPENQDFFFPLIVIPLKSTLIYCVLNYAQLVNDVIAGRKMANGFKSLSAFLTSTLAGQNARPDLVIKGRSEPSPLSLTSLKT